MENKSTLVESISSNDDNNSVVCEIFALLEKFNFLEIQEWDNEDIVSIKKEMYSLLNNEIKSGRIVFDANWNVEKILAPNNQESILYASLIEAWTDSMIALRSRLISKTSRFIAWFRQSKIKDKNWEPKIVRHKGNKWIQEFEYWRRRDWSPRAAYSELGWYVYDSHDAALTHGWGIIYPLFLHMTKCKVIDLDWTIDKYRVIASPSVTDVDDLRVQWFDWMVSNDLTEIKAYEIEYFFFSSNQVKSATSNSGIYSDSWIIYE